MNINDLNDFIVNVKTPTSCYSQHINLGDNKSRSPSCHSLSPNSKPKSPESILYSDSFDDDSPVKVLSRKKVKCINKTKCYKSTNFHRKPKGNSRVKSNILKPSEVTQKLLESNKIKINELLSENADCHRQLIEKTKEIKTLQNQNKIQEKYLKKVNTRDADVPNLISRFNSEIHSLQELLRRNKDKLDTSVKQKRDIEAELSKIKMKNEHLSSLCENKDLQAKEDLTKKIHNLNELLESEAKRNTEMERNIELLTKKHIHRINMEAGKYKELNQTYKEILAELRDVRNTLKEKTKMLEMQNVYRKIAFKPPHFLASVSGDAGDVADHKIFPGKSETMVKAAPKKEGKESPNRNNQNISDLTKPGILKKPLTSDRNCLDSVKKPTNAMATLKSLNKTSFTADTLPVVQEVKEKYAKQDRFSDLHETVRRKMQQRENVENQRAESKLAKVEQQRGRRFDIASESETKSKDSVDDKNGDNKADVLCSTESDELSSETKSSDSSSCLFLPRGCTHPPISSYQDGHGQKKGRLSDFDYLGYPRNNNNNNCYGARKDRTGPGSLDTDEEYSLANCER